MRDIRLLVKGKTFVKITLIKEDDMSRPNLIVIKGKLLEIDLETGNYIFDDNSLDTQVKYGKTYEEFKDVGAIIVVKLLDNGFFELKKFNVDKAFFKNRIKVSDNTPNYVVERLKKI